MRITRVTMLATALVLAQLTQVLIGLVAQRGANSAWSIFATGAMLQLAKTHRQMTVCKVQAQALAPHPLDLSSLRIAMVYIAIKPYSIRA